MNINRRDFLKKGALATGALGMGLAACTRQPPSPPTLWQSPGMTRGAMMGYVLKTSANEIIVIDGGFFVDAAYLFELVKKQNAGGKRSRFHVHAWLLTHPHADHVEALTMLLNSGSGADIDAIYASLPPQDWVETHCADTWDRATVQTSRNLRAALKKSGHQARELTPGQKLRFGGLDMEILAIRNPEITGNAVNNQSVVFRVQGPNKSVLFLGDLGVEGGKKLLAGPYRDRLRADYVQMAHHGQNGVDREVYEAIRPAACLWPTPGWLWDNDNGGGVNSGPWRTLQVRAWMDELGVKEHHVAKDGLCAVTL